MKMTTYKPGTPSWIELMVPDVQQAASFYHGLFGWDVDGEGDHVGASYKGSKVAAISPSPTPDTPPAWATYIAVADADTTAKAAEAAGGQVIVEPQDVPGGAGRMAVLLDTTGAAVGIWQSGHLIGAELVNEPGTLRKNDLTTRDVEGAIPFYESVFGWKVVSEAVADRPYYDFHLDGHAVAGLMPMDDRFPPELPSHWEVYFQVADTEATVEAAKARGAEIIVPPTDTGPGLFAAIHDPQGAAFNIIRMNE